LEPPNPLLTVEIHVTGVPENWDNITTTSKRGAMAVAARKREWLETIIFLGGQERNTAHIPLAEKGHPRRLVHIEQIRWGRLDKGGLYASCKPLIDGLKVVLYRGKGEHRRRITGAGLIYEDDPDHVDWDVTQTIDRNQNPLTKITVEIF
jgi:hypothetical protein